MKTIEVSDEVYEFLKSCQEELTTQNNRLTANPIFGFIQQQEVASVNNDNCVFLNYDYTDRITNTEDTNYFHVLAEYIYNDCDYDIEKINEELKEKYISEIKYKKETEVEVEDYNKYLINVIEEYLADYDYNLDSILSVFGIDMVYYEKINKMYESSVSLFESDMQAHLDLNKHNMDESCKTYVYSNFRTPKMTKLRDILKSEIKFGEIE